MSRQVRKTARRNEDSQRNDRVQQWPEMAIESEKDEAPHMIDIASSSANYVSQAVLEKSPNWKYCSRSEERQLSGESAQEIVVPEVEPIGKPRGKKRKGCQ